MIYYEPQERDLDEPEPSRRTLDEEFEREERYKDELRDVMMCKGEFWKYLDDEAYYIADAVKKAMMLPCADNATRWLIVQAEINQHADDHARWVAYGRAGR